MTPENFAYWLQGLLEVGNPKSLDEKQTEMIKKHLALVFTNVTAGTSTIGTNIDKFNHDAGKKLLEESQKNQQLVSCISKVRLC